MKKTTNPQRKVSSLTTHYSQLKMLMMKKNHDTNNQSPEKGLSPLTSHYSILKMSMMKKDHEKNNQSPKKGLITHNSLLTT